ncbi:MAG TPA: S8 family serine peptidase [Bryobacteraceae bacterium]|nr:S8 family serine peptidase [Bryobacteraceae bacterium]
MFLTVSRRPGLLTALLVVLTACPSLFGGKEFLAGPGERAAPDQLLVGLEPGADVNRIIPSIEPRAVARLISRERNTYLLRLPPGMQASVSRRLAAHPLVRYVEPNRIRNIAALPPSDPLITQQWALTAIQTVQAWSYFPDQYLTSATAGTNRVKVAALDTGVDCTHPDFMNAGGTSTDSAKGGQLSWATSEALVATTISSPACPWQDDNGHGTLTAGALAAATNNGAGIASLGFPAQLVVMKVISSSGQALDDVVAQGIDAAISEGASVISVSLAGAGYSQTLQNAMDSAWQHNVLVVAAAGNNQGTTLIYPGDGNHVLTVAATGTNNAAASFSNYGNWVKIAAPGLNIESTLPTYANPFGGTNYGSNSGTSFATSYVAALAGLLFAEDPNLSAAAVAQRIQQTAQTPNAGWDQHIGYGVINAGAALAGVSAAASQGSLTGQVVDGSNVPIGGAVVTVGNQSFTTLVDPTTGTATGLFRIANLSPGTYSIGVTASGHTAVTVQAAVVAGADTMLTIPMDETLGEVTGSVTYNGGGVEGAVVEAVSGNPGLIQETAISDTSGSYHLYLPAGTYTLLASAPNYVNTSSASQNVGTGKTTVNLALAALGTFTGNVVDENGVGIAGAHIHFVCASGCAVPGFSGGAFTAAGGKYSTYGLPSGTYNLTASASGFNAVNVSGGSITTNVATLVNFQFSTGISLTSGLLGYWPFDEDSGSVAHDQSGNGYNASLSQSSWTVGLFGYAVNFNGVSSQGVTSSIPFGSSFSISAWVNPTVTSQTAYAAVAQAESLTGLFLGVDSSGTQYKFVVDSGAGSTGSCAFMGVVSGCAQGGTISSGWHLATGTYDGTTGNLYVDGVLVASDTFTAPGSASLALSIARNYVSGAVWNGILDDLRLYSRALTAEEVSNLYVLGTTQTLQLTKTADAAAVAAGSPIGFTLAVTNGGAQTATAATLTDALPAGNGISWSINPAYSGPGSCAIANGTLSCNLGNLGAAATATVHVNSATSSGSCGIYPNHASVSALNAIQAQASATCSVQCAACAATGDGVPSVSDVQRMINETLGVAAADNDLNKDGILSVVDIQIVINSTLGLGCTY